MAEFNKLFLKDNHELQEKFWTTLAKRFCRTYGFVREVVKGLWVNLYLLELLWTS
jgi:hypothetical protein